MGFQISKLISIKIVSQQNPNAIVHGTSLALSSTVIVPHFPLPQFNKYQKGE